MPSRFLNNITVNDSYTLPSADGTADQIITTDGAGQLSFVDQSTLNSGSASRTEILVKNLEGSSLSKGDPVYIIGSVGASERLEVGLADASDSAKMPCVGLLTQDLAINGEGTAIVTGKLKNLITSPIDGATPTENDTIYVKPGGGLTLTKPAGVANLIQNVGQVGRVSTSSDGNIVVSAILRSNDVPNLTEGKIWVGSTGNTIESTVVYLDETNGRMGIGTTSPSEKLHVRAADPSILITNTTFGSGESTLVFQTAMGANNYLAVNSSNTLNYKNTSGSSIFTIENGGDVGIGTTNPQQKLDVYGGLRLGTTGDFFITQSPYTSSIFYVTGGGNGGTILFGSPASFTQNVGVQGDLWSYQGSIGTKQFGTFNNKISYNGDNYLNSGNLGIGTTNPTSQIGSGRVLDISSTGNSEIVLDHTDAGVNSDIGLYSWNRSNDHLAHIKASCDGATDSAFISFHAQPTGGSFSGPSSNEKMRIESDGNVGIGTTSPSEKLVIKDSTSNAGVKILSYNNAIGTEATLKFATVASDASYEKAAIITRNYASSFGRSDMHFALDSAPDSGNVQFSDTKMTILNNGYVGIGTTSPDLKLEIEDSGTLGVNKDVLSITNKIPSAATVNTTVGMNFNLQQNTNAAIPYGAIRVGEHLGTGSIKGSMRFMVQNYSGGFSLEEKMRIESDGNVAIGTTSPRTKLHVFGTTSSMPSLGAAPSAAQLGGSTYGTLFSTLTSGRGVIQQGRSDGTALSFDLLLQPVGGRVGIGVSAASYQLQLSSNSAAKPSSSLWTVVSDSRVKENIRDYTTGLEAILKIEPKIYDYNGKAGFEKTKDNIGIIAQDMQTIMPETIKTYNTKLNEDDTEDTELLNFDGHAVTFALINAVKDLKAEIEELKKQINK